MSISDFKKSNYSLSSGLITLNLISEKEFNDDSYKWLNDQDITKFMDKGYRENTKEKQTEYYKEMIESDTDVLFAIIENSRNLHIGNAGFHNIDIRHNRSTLGVVIGEKRYWKGGYALEVCYNLTKIGFDILKFNKIIGDYMVGNEAPKSIWRYIGFSDSGILKQHYLKNDKYIDVCMISMLRDDWINKSRK